MSNFFEKIKIIFLKKKFFGPFYNQKKSDLKMDIFFERKFTILILNVFFYIRVTIIFTMSYFFEKIKIILKISFLGAIFITKKKSDLKMDMFFEKKNYNLIF